MFTWQGCTLKLRGKKGISYISKETPMVRKNNFESLYLKLINYGFSKFMLNIYLNKEQYEMTQLNLFSVNFNRIKLRL